MLALLAVFAGDKAFGYAGSETFRFLGGLDRPVVGDDGGNGSPGAGKGSDQGPDPAGMEDVANDFFEVRQTRYNLADLLFGRFAVFYLKDLCHYLAQTEKTDDDGDVADAGHQVETTVCESLDRDHRVHAHRGQKEPDDNPDKTLDDGFGPLQ